jgi:hypothetical protein
MSPVDCDRIQAGDGVVACVGTKAGTGVVVTVLHDGRQFHVRFPDVDYPASMVVPTGEYFVGRPQILQHFPKAPA